MFENCTIYASSSAIGAEVLGIHVKNIGTITNCHIEADGHGDVDNTIRAASAIGSIVGSSVTINGGYYYGARAALHILGAAHINKGVYEGCQHGGAYMLGLDIKVKNATFRNVSYTKDCGWNATHYGAVFCGSLDGNTNVYFDNCRFESNVYTSHGIISEKSNSKVYLSNSVIDGNFGNDIRVDANNYIYIGKNVSYNAASILQNGTIDTTTYADQEFGW